MGKNLPYLYLKAHCSCVNWIPEISFVETDLLKEKIEFKLYEHERHNL
jgi:hypothetical protein